ncbi:MAG: hypothetical protein VYA84_03015 [Planctomycetota bacterium]|nr:hypothetical protein [Planctomycetota bacterium]
MLEFVASNEKAAAQTLHGIEKAKLTNYSDSVEVIRRRNRKIDEMADLICCHVPELDLKYLDADVGTFDRQIGHAEVLLGALTSGLTNVAAFTVDELGHSYTGIAGIEGEKVNMHDVGHGKSIGGLGAEEIRKRCRHHHMTLVERIVSRLKSVLEAGGSMFDNTMIFDFPDRGETHHSHGTEYPFIVLAGDNAKLNLGGRYIRLPIYGDVGHKSLGKWYTTLLNAYGNPVEHFGDPGFGLNHIDQLGPIKQLLA